MRGSRARYSHLALYKLGGREEKKEEGRRGHGLGRGGSGAKGTGDVPGTSKQEEAVRRADAGLNPAGGLALSGFTCKNGVIIVEREREREGKSKDRSLLTPGRLGRDLQHPPSHPPTPLRPMAAAGGGGAALAQPWPSSGAGSRPWLASSQGELWEGRPSGVENKQACRVGRGAWEGGWKGGTGQSHAGAL